MLKKKLPLILQSEIAECGLACLAMILGFYQSSLTLSDVRQHVRLTLKGVTLLHLKKIAQDFGFNSNVLRLDIAQLNLVTLPAIIHWDMNHFVVLKKITNKSYIIHDPSSGVRKFSRDNFDRYFTGIVLELIPNNNLLQNSIIKNPKKSNYFLSLFKKYKSHFKKLLIVSLLIQTLYIIGIEIIQKCIDSSVNLTHLPALQIFILMLLAIKLIEISTTAIRSLMITYSGNFINYDIGYMLKKHLLALPISYFENRHIGDLLSRFGAIEKIRTIITEGFVEGIVDGLISIIILVAMFLCNSKLALISFSTLLIVCCLRYFYQLKAKQLHEEALCAKAHEMSYFMETVRAISSLKIFGKTDQRQKIWASKFTKSINTTTRIVWHKNFYSMLNQLFYVIDLVLAISLACLFMNRQFITLGVFYAFLSYRQQLFNSINNLLEKCQDFKLLQLHISRLNDILNESPEIVKNNCFHLANFISHSNLILENISFSYSSDEKPIINHLNLIIKPNECVAIAGSSGCGKTTLLKIMMGMLAPSNGMVYIDNISIYPNHIQCYRDKIACVLQNDMLFSGSIADNICFFEINRDVDRIYNCAALAGISDEINSFPMRFNTLIGDMGSVLSGGQKQRILLARALYSRPDILFLDEATSHLDANKENEVNKAIRSLGITIIMIAHRKETINMADRIVHLSAT